MTSDKLRERTAKIIKNSKSEKRTSSKSREGIDVSRAAQSYREQIEELEAKLAQLPPEETDYREIADHMKFEADLVKKGVNLMNHTMEKLYDAAYVDKSAHFLQNIYDTMEIASEFINNHLAEVGTAYSEA